MRELVPRLRVAARAVLADRLLLEKGEAGCRVSVLRPTDSLAMPGFDSPSQAVRVVLIVEGDDGQVFRHVTEWLGGIRFDKHGIAKPQSMFQVRYTKAGPNGQEPQWKRMRVRVEIEPLTADTIVHAAVHAIQANALSSSR